MTEKQKYDAMGLYRNYISFLKGTITKFSLLMLLMYPEFLYSCCWSRNPDFESDPIVTELSPSIVRVLWKDILNDIDCVDHYYVHYWKTLYEHRSKQQKIHEIITNSDFFVDVDVSENTNYTFQINAFEDGTVGCGDNWSKTVNITTSKASKYVCILFILHYL